MNTVEAPVRSTANLWRGLVGWPIVLVPLAGVVAYFGTMDWGVDLVMFAFLGALVAIPIGLFGLAITSDSAGEQVVSGILFAWMMLFDVAFIIFAIAMTRIWILFAIAMTQV
jgi:hypothetical protein